MDYRSQYSEKSYEMGVSVFFFFFLPMRKLSHRQAASELCSQYLNPGELSLVAIRLSQFNYSKKTDAETGLGTQWFIGDGGEGNTCER